MIVSSLPLNVSALRPLVFSLASLIAWDILVTVLYQTNVVHLDGIKLQFTLFGSAIALFIGFMVNASYARWWEGRTMWGQIVNSSRSLSRQALTLLDADAPSARPGLAAEIVRAQVAYVHVLRTALRNQPLPHEAERYLTPAMLERVREANNHQTAITLETGKLLAEAAHRGMIGEISRVQLESTLVALTDAQGSLERINNTPLPVQYRFLPRLFSRVFCVILPFAVVQDLGWVTPIGSGVVSVMFLLAIQAGDELADPFTDNVYDIPMTTICRTIEIDLVQMIGAPTPDPVAPVEQVLW